MTILIAIELGILIILIWFLGTKVPKEQIPGKWDFTPKVEPNKTEVLEWTPPPDDDELAEIEARKSMNNG